MGGFHLKVSYVVSSNKVRVNFLAIQFGWARGLHEVVRVVTCCETRGRRGKLPGLWYYFCTETIGRKGFLLRPCRVCSRVLLPHLCLPILPFPFSLPLCLCLFCLFVKSYMGLGLEGIRVRV